MPCAWFVNSLNSKQAAELSPHFSQKFVSCGVSIDALVSFLRHSPFPTKEAEFYPFAPDAACVAVTVRRRKDTGVSAAICHPSVNSATR
jgi:hypothetical protein